MIRSHGEEGFSFEDKEFDKAYKREASRLGKQLNHRAMIFAKKYQKMNIDICTDIDMDYLS